MKELEQLSKPELIAIILELRKQNELLCKQVEELHKEVESLRKEVESLRSGSDSNNKNTPHWVKASKPKSEKKERMKRAEAPVRRKETPTEAVCHAVEHCPDCGRPLSGGWVHRTRQVIEIPITPVRIIDHIIIARRCGVCGRRHIPRVDLSQEVIGNHRVGVGLMSLVSYLRITCRIPIRTIQKLLKMVYGLHLGAGELVEILHTVADKGYADKQKLLSEIRGSPAVNADETGWREDGANGYIWSFSTPDVRYLVYNKSRSGDIPKEVIGDDFTGVVGCDFYSGYNGLLCDKQRCWVHLLRDMRKLKEDHPDNPKVSAWVKSIRDIYDRAREFESEDHLCRKRQRYVYQRELHRLVKGYAKMDVPQRVLSKRIENYLSELFVFVEYPEVPSENNAAERAVRPAVIARKVSGGTRSEKGSNTKMTLMSLFGTWALRGINPIEACRQMLVASE